MSAFAGRRVLVTGANGFLASRLVPRLSAEGAIVHGASRSEVDLTNQADVDALFSQLQPQIVFHLSGYVSAVPDLAAVVPTFQTLVESTVYLLNAATRAGGACERFVLVGSLTEPAEDETAQRPSSPYVAAKWAASLYGRLFQRLYRAPVVTTHLAYTYGPGQPANRLIPQVIDALLRGEAPKVSSGALRADWAYIDDIIDGLLAAGSEGAAAGRDLDLGSGTLVSVREVVEQLVRLSGTSRAPEFGVVPDRPIEQFRPARAAQTRALIGWRAKTPLEQGLQQTLDWKRRALAGAPA